MAEVRSRRRSLFDSDEEDEPRPSVERPSLGAAPGRPVHPALQPGSGDEDSEAQAEQAPLRRLEHRNSRALFSDDDDDDDDEQEGEPERPRASSSGAHRKPVLFDSDDERWFHPDAQRKAAVSGSGDGDNWQSKYEEERRKRLELERELAECQEKLAALQTFAAAMEALVPAEALARLADEKRQEMAGRTKDEEEFDKEWQAMAQAEAERRAKKRQQQQRRSRAGNTTTRVHLRQARKSVRMAALTPPLATAAAPSLSPTPTDVSHALARGSSASASASSSGNAATGSATAMSSPWMKKTLSADSAKQESVGVTDDGWDSSGSEGWSDDEPSPSRNNEGAAREAAAPAAPAAAIAAADATSSVTSSNVAPTRGPFAADVEQEVLQWAQRNDIVAMLMTVQQVFSGPLPPPPAWQRRPDPDDVRRAYLRVVRYCHPDKVAALGVASFSGSQAAYHLAIAQSKLVFGALTDAYSMYKQLNGL